MTVVPGSPGDGKDGKEMGPGIVLGAVIGIYSDDLALWIPLGIALGVAIGVGLSKR